MEYAVRKTLLVQSVGDGGNDLFGATCRHHATGAISCPQYIKPGRFLNDGRHPGAVVCYMPLRGEECRVESPHGPIQEGDEYPGKRGAIGIRKAGKTVSWLDGVAQIIPGGDIGSKPGIRRQEIHRHDGKTQGQGRAEPFLGRAQYDGPMAGAVQQPRRFVRGQVSECMDGVDDLDLFCIVGAGFFQHRGVDLPRDPMHQGADVNHPMMWVFFGVVAERIRGYYSDPPIGGAFSL